MIIITIAIMLTKYILITKTLLKGLIIFGCFVLFKHAFDWGKDDLQTQKTILHIFRRFIQTDQYTKLSHIV